jgi:predicted alpha-1,2-mannosidase
MKLTRIIVFLFCILLFSGSCNWVGHRNDLSQLVNPFIGTGADGNTYPGASMPFGGVQLSPDTRLNSCSGYNYSDNTIIGFSHTHLSGVGEPEYRDVLFMPTVGKIQWQPGDAKIPKSGYRSTFSHRRESATPGYYKVWLQDYNIKAELTTTLRCGFHRYTFPESDSAHVVIDLAYPGGADELYLKKVSDTEIEGLRRSNGWAWDQYVYFVARFSKSFSSVEIARNDSVLTRTTEAHGRNVKAVVSFRTKKNEIVLVKVGISAVSTEGARKNLDAEIPEWDFNGTAVRAKEAWNTELSKIEVEGGSIDNQSVFYTSIYHAFLNPNIFMDVDGQYRGTDHQVHTAKGFTNYTVFSLWDTFRALHPLFTIVDQKRTTDFIKTLLQIYDDGGRLPMWPLAGNYTDDMLGYHAVPVIVDAYMKGIRNFDVQKAFRAEKEISQMDRLGLKYYKKIGYLPADRQGESVSKTLEYCYDDWCIAQMAKSLGATDDYAYYNERAHFWHNVFDPSVGFMRGKNYDHSWLTPFDPLVNSAYSEGNAYQYMFVPHDVDGLIGEMGGDAAFSKWLDVLFSLNTEKSERGMIGQYWHGNEPSHHLAYLYDYSGEAWKTQKLVHQILTQLYTNTPEGLAGNEDCGQMSAWYILSSMGFYPVAPGQTIYAIGTPLFKRATINLESGKEFVIVANNLSDQNIYIQSARLNGKDYPNSYLRHEDLMNGGELEFEMGPQPNLKWGSAPKNRPHSENGEPVVLLPYVESGDTLFQYSTDIALNCETPGAKVYYTLDGSEPTEQSSFYSKPFRVSQSCVLKMKAFAKDLTPSIVIPVCLTKAVFQPAEKNLNAKSGLAYDYFERFFVTTADLDISKPLKSGITDRFSIENAPRSTYFGYRFQGYIRLPGDGIYNFFLSSNDGSTLYIDGKELIENDGNHGTVEEPGQIALKAGFHSIMVKYMQCGGGKSLKVSWSGPGMQKHEIQPDELFVEK